jgi:formylmethanofuran dehydrogenase subunit E
MSKANYCHVADDRCAAPAGIRVGNGIWHGDKKTKLECHRCGLPVCRKCSSIVDGKRICNDCRNEERRHA